MTSLEDMPLLAHIHIAKYLNLPDVLALSRTNKHMRHLCFNQLFCKGSDGRFQFGPWYGNWDNNVLSFQNSPIDRIECKTFLYLTVDHSCARYYKMFIYLREDYESTEEFYKHPYIPKIKQWLEIYFPMNHKETSVKIITRLSPNRIPMKKYIVHTPYRKRDHYNLIGLSLCWHKCSYLNHEKYSMSQRIGIHSDEFMFRYEADAIDKGPIKLHIISNINIFPTTQYHMDNPDKYMKDKSIIHTTINFIFTSTKCYVETDMPSTFENMEVYYQVLELSANAVRSLLDEMDYQKIQDMARQELPSIASKLMCNQNEIELDIPASIQELWEQVQDMVIYHFYR